MIGNNNKIAIEIKMVLLYFEGIETVGILNFIIGVIKNVETKKVLDRNGP